MSDEIQNNKYARRAYKKIPEVILAGILELQKFTNQKEVENKLKLYEAMMQHGMTARAEAVLEDVAALLGHAKSD